MSATVFITGNDICVFTKKAVPYYDCPCGNRHEFADPARLGRLLDGFATVHPKPTCEAVPYTDPLPGGHE